ncbi:MAG: hypothetical protein IPM66_00440 [Acidobacteriota bacterium]|nr:MAG: hypothetical protein IPM66_00440 [Acidobacteriota bacterium]
MRFVRTGLILLAAIVLVVALIVVYAQRPFAESFFEFGNLRDYEGVIIEKPVPMLVTEEGGHGYVLVAEGKHGADSIVHGLGGKVVSLRGTLIHRDGLEMIEVASVSVLKQAATGYSGNGLSIGNYTLSGEIVDSKCYLGVMNPGSAKPHRECASLCIRGGIPPLFVVRDPAGRSVHLWLLARDRTQVNQQILDFVAEPVRIAGSVERIGDKQYFLIDPADIQRLNR